MINYESSAATGGKASLPMVVPLYRKPREPGHRVALPPAIAADYRILKSLPTACANRQDWLVTHRKTDAKAVLTRYRGGVRPAQLRLADVIAKAPVQAVQRTDPMVHAGRWFELSEYFPLGTVAEITRSVPPSLSFVRELLEALAGTLRELHGAGIIHGRLSPDVLVLRNWYPLALALDGFDPVIFDDGALGHDHAPLRYRAPEAAAGMTSPAADYWSMGVLLTELITGRHPYGDIDEAQYLHTLLTGTPDVSGVGHPLWRALCQGLLLREPAHRWGAVEISAWLRGGVPALPVSAAAGFNSPVAMQPFQVDTTLCYTAAALATALEQRHHAQRGATDWPAVAEWLRKDLGDIALAGCVDAAASDATFTEGRRLLELCAAARPGTIPDWQGIPLRRDALLAQAVKAVRGEPDARLWVVTVYNEELLASTPELRSINAAWRSEFKGFKENFLSPGQLDGFPREHLPESAAVLPVLLAQMLSVDFSTQLRQKATRAATPLARRAIWFRNFPAPDRAAPHQVLLWLHLGPKAERLAKPRQTTPIQDLPRESGNLPELLPLLRQVSLLAVVCCVYVAALLLV